MTDYCNRLGLSFDPFAAGNSASGFFSGGNRQQLLEQLIEQALYGKSLLLVTGSLGTGKSELARRFCGSFEDEALIAMVGGRLFMDAAAFLEQLVTQLALPDRSGDVEQTLYDIARLAASLELEARSLILVIDDAHEISSEVLDCLSALVQHDKAGNVRIVLLGEPQTGDMLQAALPSRLAQRLVTIPLDTLDPDETLAYIDFKLAGAGYNGPLPIPEATLQALATRAKGIPGTINALVADALEQDAAAPAPRGQLPQQAPPRQLTYWASAAALFALLVAAILLLPEPRLQSPIADAGTRQAQGRLSIPLQLEAGASTSVASPAAAPLGQPAAEAETAGPAAVAVAAGAEPTAPATEQAEAATTTAAPLEPEPEPGSVLADSPGSRQSVPPAHSAAPPRAASSHESRLLQLPDSNFTLQVMGSFSEANVQRFVDASEQRDQLAYFETRFQDRPWYVVVFGNYPDRAAATSAISDMPASLRSLQPWVRSLADVQSDIRRLQAGSQAALAGAAVERR